MVLAGVVAVGGKGGGDQAAAPPAPVPVPVALDVSAAVKLAVGDALAVTLAVDEGEAVIDGVADGDGFAGDSAMPWYRPTLPPVEVGAATRGDVDSHDSVDTRRPYTP